ncbi:uncharacterized protein LOC124352679 isoform X2 [Homalodisca vitripennis]|uniref:uncharacterized protein LOC124352679 isoform X2 n=1 Tax=Homalodisca vitripennis TaxID=197043 RepID=UPI001EEC7C68|nr:uncharacterized protein LOC124352679 isoform X2 [Homalodisca vitripennis]
MDLNAAGIKVQSTYISSSDEITDKIIVPEKEIQSEDNVTKSTVNTNIFSTVSELNLGETLQIVSLSQKTDIPSSEEITEKIIVPVSSHAEEIQYEESASKATLNVANSSNLSEPILGETLEASSSSQKTLEQQTENSKLLHDESIDVSTEEQEAKLSSLSEVACTENALSEVLKSGISSESKDNYNEILGNEELTIPNLPELICERTNIHQKFDDEIQSDTMKFSELTLNEVAEQKTNDESSLFKCDMVGYVKRTDENLFQNSSHKEVEISLSMEKNLDPADSIQLTNSSLSEVLSETDLGQNRLERVESGGNMFSESALCTIEEKLKDHHLPSELPDEKEDCIKPNNSIVDNDVVTIPQSENIIIPSEVKTVPVTTDEKLNLVSCEEEMDFETKESYSESTTILDEQMKEHIKSVDIDENSDLNEISISSHKALQVTENKEALGVKEIELSSPSINFMEIPVCVEQTTLENRVELSEVKNTNIEEELYDISTKKEINHKTNETYSEPSTILDGVLRQEILIDKNCSLSTISTELAQTNLDITDTKEFFPQRELHSSNIKCTEGVPSCVETAEQVDIINHKPVENTVNMNSGEKVTLRQSRVDCNILEIRGNDHAVEKEFTEVHNVNCETSTKGLEEVTSLHETSESKDSCNFAPPNDFANTEVKSDLKSQAITEFEHNISTHNPIKNSLSDEAQIDSVSISKERHNNPVMIEHVLESENSLKKIHTDSIQIEEANIVVEKSSEILDTDISVVNTETGVLKMSSDSLNSTENNILVSNSVEVTESGISVQQDITCSDESLSRSFSCTSSNDNEANSSFLNTKQSLEEMESKLYSEFTLTNLKVDQILSKHEPIESLASKLINSPATQFDEKEYRKTPKSKSPGYKTNKSKSPPKRSLIKDFKTSCVTDPSNSRDDNIEIFVASEKLDVTFDAFDERLAEEAANVSEHILSLSHDLQDSDSDGENNRTVITLNEEKSKVVGQSSNVIVSASPSLLSSHRISSRGETIILETQPFVGVNTASFESYLQSMRSVHPTDLNQSEAGPITADELSTQDLEFQDGSNLDLDYFTRGSETDTVVKSSLTRDSLYVKFDPIVGAIVSKTVSDSFAMPPPPAPAPEGETNNREEQLESHPDEPKEDSLVQGQGEPQKTPGRSPALEAVQKLISLTPPSASSGTPVKIPSATPAKSERGSVGGLNTNTPSPRISQEHLQRELNKLEELLMSQDMSHKGELEKKDAEIKRLTAKLSEMEAGAKALTEREIRLKKEVQEKTKSRQQLSLVMEEYEKTISQLVAQKEEEKKESEVQKELLMKERDTAMQHLNNMEIAFNDVHQKYERSKTVIEGMKANEDVLKRSLAEYDEAIKTANSKYESLKNHAIRQLETANQELDLIRRSHQVEQAKLKAMLKKAEVRVTSLEESLEQKSKENQELAAICDELINKVGSGTN